ncbi:hypothetical protein SAMN04487831_12217 [Pseudobutyrivibrio sp. UC1225]|uniref:hypothetical protein n=1 Tax=Pseudobutyrivibrio sp. UC1225 TaxID=1798185 RepID=UPI0008E9E645|nr:hypothetical protein [Pseudobutyrivibrio sp. UC1225]SFO34169.1 hypothetical protein SAMN04487831_12217 [Pseudobutyrivibrio sp. UC1225]
MRIIKYNSEFYRFDKVNDGYIVRGNSTLLHMDEITVDFIFYCYDRGIKDGVDIFMEKYFVDEDEMKVYLKELKEKLIANTALKNFAEDIERYLGGKSGESFDSESV